MPKIFSLKALLSIFIALFLVSMFFSTPSLALEKAQSGLDATAETGFGSLPNEDVTISSTIGKVVGYALSFVGVIFLILIIYAGFTWMLARGNEAEVKKAKDLMFDAVIGLVIILSAYAITAFVGNSLAN